MGYGVRQANCRSSPPQFDLIPGNDVIAADRAAALAAIGRASKPALSLLIKTLDDEEWQVRKPAADALAAIGPSAKAAVPALRSLLNDPEVQVRRAAAIAIKRIDEQAAQ